MDSEFVFTSSIVPFPHGLPLVGANSFPIIIINKINDHVLLFGFGNEFISKELHKLFGFSATEIGMTVFN